MKWTQKHSENLANQGQVILPPELRKNALLISQSGSSNFALYMIKNKFPAGYMKLLTTF
jgi:hypothetical protein